MNLAERLEELAHPSTKCKVAVLIDSLDEHTASVLERVLKSTASNRILAETLTSYGHQVGRSSVGLHRTGRCSCGGANELG